MHRVQNYAKSPCFGRFGNSIQGLSKRDEASLRHVRGKHEFIFPLVSFNDCTYIIALNVQAQLSNISSFQLKGCDILVLRVKTFFSWKVFLSFVIYILTKVFPRNTAINVV